MPTYFDLFVSADSVSLDTEGDLIDKVWRVSVGDVIRLTLLVNDVEVFLLDNKQVLYKPTDLERLDRPIIEIPCSVSGPMTIIILGANTTSAPKFLVESSLIPDIKALCLESVISQRLGHVERDWDKMFEVIRRQKFNAVHFTPVQELGASRSSYSIADFLKVSPQIADSWDQLEVAVQKIEKEYGIYSFCDIVLNHIASNAPSLQKYPQIGYNQKNSPWLKGAMLLDDLFKEFTEDLVNGKVKSGQNLSPHVHSAHDVDRLVDSFVHGYLNPRFHVRNWFTLDAIKSFESYKLFRFEGKLSDNAVPSTDVPLSEIVEGASGFTEAARRCVGQEENFCVRGDVLEHFAHGDEKKARDLLAWAQQALWEESSAAYSSCIDAMRGTLTYERIEQKKGPITFEPWNSVVPWYFTKVHAADGEDYWLANNGWVMGWNGARGFIERGSNVYLKRSLVAWSDCVKLRYGTPRNEKREECPELWDLMSQYAELTARVFHGFRLDNCHTTPLAVAKHVLTAARKVRPNLFVFAELFTGSERADVVFEEKLGIDALVREAIQTSSPGDEAYHALKYSTTVHKSLGELDESWTAPTCFTVCPKDPSSRLSTLTCRRSVNVYYDCTHDNETWVQKSRACDALASAAMVTASGCIAGSTFGYESLVRSNPSVVADGTLYPIESFVLPASETKTETQSTTPGHTRITHYAPNAQSVYLWGAHNQWKEGLAMAKTSSGEWALEVCTESLSVGKFVVDGRWECSSRYGSVADAKGNVNNDLTAPFSTSVGGALDVSSGLIEGRRLLNEFHADLGNGYNEMFVNHCTDDLVCITRANATTGETYHFVIRSGWWTGNPKPGCPSIALMGRCEVPLLCAHVSSSTFDHNPNSWGLGLTRSVLKTVSHPKCYYDSSSDVTWISFSDDFPSGSVCVYKTVMERADAQIERLVKSSSAAFDDLNLYDVNALMWSCDEEERDRSMGSRGVYLFPDMDHNVVYAGVMGVIDSLKSCREKFGTATDRGIYKNVREGDWLIDYHLSRVESLLGSEHKLTQFWRQAHRVITATKRPVTKPRAVERLFSFVFEQLKMRILSNATIKMNDPLVNHLLVATTQLAGRVNSARMNEWTPESISAGLPFFTKEYMREWGRDTMLSIFGLTACLNRWDLMKQSILCYARVIRHGMVPNLLDSSTNPRYNARDAVHFWLNAIQRYCLCAPNGIDILNEIVYLKYPHGLEYDVPMLSHKHCKADAPAHEYCLTLKDCVLYVLYAHYNGIRYREWNAGYKIDSQMVDDGFNVSVRRDERTGFCIGGNRNNCGTWMDKMGSSEKAGNKGKPSSPRDGAPVELTLALYSTLCWVTGKPSDVLPHVPFGELDSDTLNKYTAWREQMKTNFVPCYVVTADDASRFRQIAHCGAIKDVYGGALEEEDYYLRCNYSVGLGLLLHTDIVPKCVAIKALSLAKEMLVCEPNQVGMKTLNPQNPRYRANYDNANDSTDIHLAHGWNYHQGPEWVFPYGFWFEAMWKYLSKPSCVSHEGGECLDESTLSEIRKNIPNQLVPVRNRAVMAPWFSLPEITDSDGRVCRDGCQAQAWSIATFLSFFWLVDFQEKSTKVTSETTSKVPQPQKVETEVSAARSGGEDSPGLPRAADFISDDENVGPICHKKHNEGPSLDDLNSVDTAERA